MGGLNQVLSKPSISQFYAAANSVKSVRTFARYSLHATTRSTRHDLPEPGYLGGALSSGLRLFFQPQWTYQHRTACNLWFNPSNIPRKSLTGECSALLLHAIYVGDIMGSIPNSDTQTERLVLALRERILKGEFPPGERLTELGLVSLLQASRTPIRLALERLASEGLLDAIPSGGFRIRSFRLVDVWDAIEIRGILEGTAVRFAAERFEAAEELVELKRLSLEATMQIPITLEGFTRYLDTNKNFHRELWRLAKSSSLYRELEHICKIPFAAPEALVFSVADLAHSIAFIAAEHHRAIVESIEHREGARGEALAREHSRIAKRNLEFIFRSKESSKRLPGAALITTNQ